MNEDFFENYDRYNGEPDNNDTPAADKTSASQPVTDDSATSLYGDIPTAAPSASSYNP